MPVGRLVLLLLGLVVAGAGFLASVLPREVHLDDAAGRRLASVSCDPPAIDAFREAAEVPGGWFAYAPNTSVVFNESGICVSGSRRRLSAGAAALAVGLVIVARLRPVESAVSDR